MTLIMNVFKGRHFSRDIILWAVRRYCKHDISYRELQEMLAERDINVDHTTWVGAFGHQNSRLLVPEGISSTYLCRLYKKTVKAGNNLDKYLYIKTNV